MTSPRPAATRGEGVDRSRPKSEMGPGHPGEAARHRSGRVARVRLQRYRRSGIRRVAEPVDEDGVTCPATGFEFLKPINIKSVEHCVPSQVNQRRHAHGIITFMGFESILKRA